MAHHCMAWKQNKKFPLKFLVDKEENRVVVAEASRDFVDTLFSFLTLPLGTIIRLLSKKQRQDQLAKVGCIKNLYHSVEISSDEVFWNHTCKQMLLCPRNPCESLCQKLKLNVDDTKPSRYFICSSRCQVGSELFLSTFEGTSCCACGELMNKKVRLLVDPSEEPHGDGVFVKGEGKYLVFDDLKVLQNSPTNFSEELSQRGYKDFNKLTEMSSNVGLKKILDLVIQAWTSKSPLSAIFLANENGSLPPIEELRSRYSRINPISLKVIMRKSERKILCAEVEEDFVEFLFSFLTASLGSILKLLDGNFSLGCMHNLYNSVKNLNSSQLVRTPLLDPKVAPQFGFGGRLIQFDEQATPQYWYGGTSSTKNNITNVDENGVIAKKFSLVKNPRTMKLFDPRSLDGKSDKGFVRRPSRFLVWDDLKVTPLANTSIISLMQGLEVPLDDLEEQKVSIEETEALKLLRASLTSEFALIDVLSDLLKKKDKDARA